MQKQKSFGAAANIGKPNKVCVDNVGKPTSNIILTLISNIKHSAHSALDWVLTVSFCTIQKGGLYNHTLK